MKTLWLTFILSFSTYAQLSLKDLRLTESDYKRLKFESRREKNPQVLMQKNNSIDKSRFYLMAECVQFNGFSFRATEPGYDDCLQQRNSARWVNMGLQWNNKK